MKRYFFSLLAVAIALSTVAFTSPKKSMTTKYVFQFDPGVGNSYQETRVEDPAHWQYIGQDLSLCDDNDTKACRIAVTEDFVDNTLSPSALSGVTIQADLSGTDIAYVESITGDDDMNEFSNKP